ncbi:MAG: pyridoxamine 5'-phosphate oxidase [Acidobacteria bacterium]|nr:MAG: pyridoxamine 5'-phosphate oxidase [Acidobacteriota bacterium]
MPRKKKSISKPAKPRASRPHMPGYGLPKGTKGLLPWTWADRLLHKSHNYWIATSKPDGAPHVMIVWALWLDGRIYFSTGSKSRKAKNLDRNSKCVMCTERANQAVIVEGVAERVRDLALLRRMLSLYERKYKFDMSGFEKNIFSYKEPIFAVRPVVVFGLDEKKTLNSATRWEFPAS